MRLHGVREGLFLKVTAPMLCLTVQKAQYLSESRHSFPQLVSAAASFQKTESGSNPLAEVSGSSRAIRERDSIANVQALGFQRSEV